MSQEETKNSHRIHTLIGCLPTEVSPINALRVGHGQDLLQIVYDIVIYALTLRWHTYESFSGFLFIPLAIILALALGGTLLAI